MAATERPLPPGPGQQPQHNNQYSENTLSNNNGQGLSSVQEAAIELLSHGFSVIPTNADKTPALPSWKHYQKVAMSAEAAEQQFRNGCRLAVICGTVSGNLECLDFDKPELYQPFIDTLAAINHELAGSIVKRQTPSGGYHLIYRCQQPVAGNQKLAMSADGKDTWIETRGQGGYFLTTPSSGYSLLEHSLKAVPALTFEDKELLHSLARSFSERQDPPLYEKTITATGERPGDDFNSKADESVWRNLLESEGWIFTGRVTSGGEHLTRPGKHKGTSATLKKGYLYVFSSNAGLPLGPHDAFGVYAHLRHHGDFSNAAKELGGQDYGKIGKKKMQAEDWPDPPPLVAKIEPEPYPIDALPDIVQHAVEEVLSFTKAPIPLVASSALAAISLATQAHIDVKRAEKLIGPVSLFLLTIADSGERKSTCDKFFTAAIQQYQREQDELAKPELKDYEAAINAWDAKRSGLMGQIKQLARKNEPTIEVENTIRELEHLKPEPPRVPKLLRGDETPENLAWVLACEWPSGGVVSSEAGVVFGAHGMGKDSIMRNLALLNILWDGGELSIGRRTTESFTVRGARLTVALQVQEATLRSFFERSGELARGTGFLARFLVAWPESTQGFRPYTDPPPCWPALAAFNQRLSEILNTPAPLEEDGTLSPSLLDLSREAKSAWVAFHDAIESELHSGGQLYDVRDVASKVADNAARLAGLFQVFDDGMGGTISSKSFQSASRIAAWHLNEARRFFGELALPEEIKNAVLLNDWLLDYCRKERVTMTPCRTVQQFGPNTLRTKAKLDAALQELESQERLQVIKEGKRKIIQLNLRLLEEVQK